MPWSWLKQYIDFIIHKKTKAKNLLEKDFFMLMNNSVFEKIMENIHSRFTTCDKQRKAIQNQLVRTSNMKTKKTYYLITNNLIIISKLSEATIINLEAMSLIKCQSCFADKRYLINDGIQTYAYGHYKITK